MADTANVKGVDIKKRQLVESQGTICRKRTLVPDYGTESHSKDSLDTGEIGCNEGYTNPGQGHRSMTVKQLYLI